MSSTSADFKTVNITDPRLHFDDQINYGVRGGASSISSVTFPAQSKSLTSHSFQINVPSLNTVVSKRVLWKCKVVYKVIGRVTEPGTFLVNYGKTCAPSVFPLHQSCITQTCQINSNTISINTRDVMLPLLRLNSKDAINDLNSISPNQFDNLANYESSYNDVWEPQANCVLADSTYTSEYWHPRGSFRLLKIGRTCDDNGTVSDIPLAGTNPNDVRTTYLEFEFTEPLMFLSPFTAFDSAGAGLFGIQNLTFNFTLESENTRALRMITNPELNTDTKITVQAYNSSELQLEFLSPHDTTVLPSRCISNYYEVPRYILASNVAVEGLTQQTVQFNTFSLNQIPDMLIIYARKKVADQTISDTDLNLAIKKININFNNNSGLLSSYTTEQLFNITRKNNLNCTWDDFSGLTNSYIDSVVTGNTGTIGAPLVLKFGEDIPLSNSYLAPGSMGQFSIQFSLDIYNQTLQTVVPEIVMIAVNSGLFVSYAGSSSIYSGILSKSDVINCKMNEVPISETDIRRLVGHGSFMDKLKKMPSSVMSFIRQHHKALGSLAKKGLSEVLPNNEYAKIGVKGLSMLGYGGDSGGSRSGGRALLKYSRK